MTKKLPTQEKPTTPTSHLSSVLMLIAVAVFVGMSGYEWLKQLLFPNISIWKSHIITIIFSTLLVTTTAYFVLRRYWALWTELQRARATLDAQVAERTQALQTEVAEHQKTEAALRESEERLRVLSNAAFEAIFLLDKGLCLSQNLMAQKTLGYTPEEAIGKPATDWFAPEEQSYVMGYIMAGDEEPYETIAQRKDGTTFAAEIQGRSIRYHGRQVRVLALRDITAHQEAESALRESRENLRATLHAIGDAVIVTDAQERVTRLNPVSARLTGWSSDKAQGKPLTQILKLIQARTRKVAFNPVSRVLLTGDAMDITDQTVLIDRDGSEYQITGSCAPIRDAKGHVTGAVLVFQDVTEKHRRQEKIKRTYTLLKAVIEQSPVPMALATTDTIELFNQACLDFLGVPDANFTGKRLDEVEWSWKNYTLDDVYIPPESSPIAKALRGEVTHNQEIKLVDKDGNVRYNVTEGVPIRDAEGKVIAGFIIFPDITDRKCAEKALQASKQRLEATLSELQATQQRIVQQERLAAIGQLSTGIAHDFRNLLATIILYAQMSLRNPTLAPKLKNNLNTIVSESKKAADLVQQILDFSSHSMIQVQALDLRTLVQNVLGILRRTIPANIELALETHAAEAAPFAVAADPGRIEQVLMNLALNARDAMPQGGALHFELSNLHLDPEDVAPVKGMLPGDWVRLSTSDTGTGMTKDVREHIFEPFFTTKNVGEGTGLGLAQVYGIVRQHAGHVGVETEVGVGSTFHIYLPATTLEEQHISKPDSEAPTGHGETILLVEDNDVLREAGRHILKSLGYRPLIATNGREALTLYELADDLDIVITDIIMPEMGGATLIRQMRKNHPNLKVIGITGYTTERIAEDLKAVGFLDVVHKPFEIDRLARVIHRVLLEK